MKKNVLLFLLLTTAQTLLFAQENNPLKLPSLKIPESWKPQSPELRFADNKQGLDSLIFRLWDPDNSLWINNAWEIYTYDSQALPETGLIRHWDTNQNDWIDATFDEYSYNADRQIEEITSSYWDITTAQWIVSAKETYSYNTDGSINEVFYSYWDMGSNMWLPATKDAFAYNGNMITRISSYWEPNTSSWYPEAKEEQTYDAFGNLTLAINYNWDFLGNTWVESEKRELTYDITTGTIEQTTSNWDTNTSSWVPDQLETISVDLTTGDILENTLALWNQDSTDWVLTQKTEFNYNGAYTSDDLSLPPRYSMDLQDFFNHMLTQVTFYDWDSDLGEWELLAEINLYYSEKVITSSSEVLWEKARVAPNPVADELTFDIPQSSGLLQFNCFNLNGTLVQSAQILNGQAVDVSTLPPGAYIYVLHTGKGKNFRGKFIKK